MVEEDLRFLVYVSSAVRLFSHEELVGLLRRSRTNNAHRGITGMLLYDSGNFIQAIEGPRDRVDTLFEKIRGDPRHKQVTVIEEGPLGERQLKNYTMGFINGADLSEEDRAGYTNFLREPHDTSRVEANPHAALRLLLAFRRHARWRRNSQTRSPYQCGLGPRAPPLLSLRLRRCLRRLTIITRKPV